MPSSVHALLASEELSVWVDDYAEERPRRLSSNRDDPSLVSDRRVMRTASYHRRDTVYSAVGPLP